MLPRWSIVYSLNLLSRIIYSFYTEGSALISSVERKKSNFIVAQCVLIIPERRITPKKSINGGCKIYDALYPPWHQSILAIMFPSFFSFLCSRDLWTLTRTSFLVEFFSFFLDFWALFSLCLPDIYQGSNSIVCTVRGYFSGEFWSWSV